LIKQHPKQWNVGTSDVHFVISMLESHKHEQGYSYAGVPFDQTNIQNSRM
jgi:hypothetical protein